MQTLSRPYRRPYVEHYKPSTSSFFFRTVAPPYNEIKKRRNTYDWIDLIFLSFGMKSLRPEGSENIPILFQGADLCFSNQNDLRNPKMGSKQSVVVPTVRWFFQITFLGTKNHQINWTVSLLIDSPIITLFGSVRNWLFRTYFLDSLGHSGLKNLGLPPGTGSGCFQSSQDVVFVF